MASVRSRNILSILFAITLLAGCGDAAVTAVNPLTGEQRGFETEEDIPEGWIVCASEETCPAPRPCDELEEPACLTRADCSPVYVGIGAYPRECEGPEPPDICDGEAFAGCTDAAPTCDPEDCGPAPLGATWLCPDGSVGGVTGRCTETASGVCGWEVRECPPPPPAECDRDACGPAPLAPAYECPDGSIGGNTGRCLAHPDGTCGWEIRECPPDSCETRPGEPTPPPACDIACPPGTKRSTGPDGCPVCGCEPTECTSEECGPAPGAPAYECSDGSIGGNIGLCERNPDGVCGWVFRECPPDACAPEDCGPAPLAPAYQCPDGSIGGNTGRCLARPDGTCGWEFRECPDVCAAVPQCDFLCPPGTHSPTDGNGCVHTCECVPDAGPGD